MCRRSAAGGRSFHALCTALHHVRPARGGVLVLGGGFAGSYVARGLGRTGATIVNPTTFMLYTPILPEAASGTLEPRHAVVGIRAMCPHAELLVGRVTAIDTDRRVAHVASDAGPAEVGYEQLVVALGAVTRLAARAGTARTRVTASRISPTRSRSATTSSISSSSRTPIPAAPPGG